MQKAKDIFDREELLERLSGDEEAFQEIIPIYVENVSSFVAELDVAIANEDLHQTEQIAHRIKGSSANVSAGAIYKISTEIEFLARNKDLSAVKQLFPELVEQLRKFKAHISA